MFRRLYLWTVSWAQSPYGDWALFVLAFCESSFFPIPPDVLLVALAVAVPKRAFRYALYCSAGSVLGGAFGYFLGWQFMDTVGEQIVDFYHMTEQYQLMAVRYEEYGAWVTAIAGFTPIPYKLITITAGAFKINFGVFMLASALSRSARFFIVAALIHRFGPRIQPFIEKYLDWLAIAFVVLLVGGFVVVKYLF